MVFSVAFCADGSCIISESHDQTLRTWNAATGECVAVEPRQCSLALSPDGSRFAFASNDETLRVWDAATGEFVGGCVAELEVHTEVSNSELPQIAFSPDGSRITSRITTVRVWDAATGECLATLEGHFDEGHFGEIHSVTFSPDGSRIASGSKGKTVRVRDAASGACVSTLEGHSGHVL